MHCTPHVADNGIATSHGCPVLTTGTDNNTMFCPQLLHLNQFLLHVYGWLAICYGVPTYGVPALRHRLDSFQTYGLGLP
jgi:hypothetical protein